MQVAERTKLLAPEQYQSRKRHRAIDLAVNKALTVNIMRQFKGAGAIMLWPYRSCTSFAINAEGGGSKEHHQLPLHNPARSYP